MGEVKYFVLRISTTRSVICIILPSTTSCVTRSASSFLNRPILNSTHVKYRMGFLAKRSNAAFFNLPFSLIKCRFSKTDCVEASASSSLIRPALMPLRKKKSIALRSKSSIVANSLVISSHERPIFFNMNC